MLAYARGIRGAELTLLLLCSFALGNLVQEAGDRLIKRLVNKRFFRQARDQFWASDLKQSVCDKIVRLGGPANPSVDAAFDFCLTSPGRRIRKTRCLLGYFRSQPFDVGAFNSGSSSIGSERGIRLRVEKPERRGIGGGFSNCDLRLPQLEPHGEIP